MIINSLQFAVGTMLLAFTVVRGTQYLAQISVWASRHNGDWLIDVAASVRVGVLIALACLGIAIMRSAS